MASLLDDLLRTKTEFLLSIIKELISEFRLGIPNDEFVLWGKKTKQKYLWLEMCVCSLEVNTFSYHTNTTSWAPFPLV